MIQQVEKQARAPSMAFEDYRNVDNEQFNIQIQISRIGVRTQIIYCVEGEDSQGSFQSERRWIDFKVIRKILIERWPACLVPPVPKETIIETNSAEDKINQNTQDSLFKFCQQMIQLKHLWYSGEFQIFLRSQPDELQKKYDKLPPLSNEYLIQKYKIVFSSLQDVSLSQNIQQKQPISSKIMARYNQVKILVANILPNLQNLKQIALNICQQRKSTHFNVAQLFEFLLPQYEENIFQEYIYAQDSKLIMSTENINQDLSDAIKTYREAINDPEQQAVYDIIRVQLKEVKGLTETFTVQAKYEAQLNFYNEKVTEARLKLQRSMTGRGGIKNFFMGSSKKDTGPQIEKELQELEKERAKMKYLFEVLVKILVYREFDRIQEYYSSVQRVALFEIKLASLKKQLYECLMDHATQKQDTRGRSESGQQIEIQFRNFKMAQKQKQVEEKKEQIVRQRQVLTTNSYLSEIVENSEDLQEEEEKE